MPVLQPDWVAAARLQGTLATADLATQAQQRRSEHQKRLALATAVAKQHIALGLLPQHTRALRPVNPLLAHSTPAHHVSPKLVNAVLLCPDLDAPHLLPMC